MVRPVEQELVSQTEWVWGEEREAGWCVSKQEWMNGYLLALSQDAASATEALVYMQWENSAPVA